MFVISRIFNPKHILFFIGKMFLYRYLKTLAIPQCIPLPAHFSRFKSFLHVQTITCAVRRSCPHQQIKKVTKAYLFLLTNASNILIFTISPFVQLSHSFIISFVAYFRQLTTKYFFCFFKASFNCSFHFSKFGFVIATMALAKATNLSLTALHPTHHVQK